MRRWLLGGRSGVGGDNFIQHLLEGDIDRFERQLYEMLERASDKDVTERTQEAFYQGLMLGCFLLLDPKRYTYDSNRESGKVGKWESGKVGKWESGKVGKGGMI